MKIDRTAWADAYKLHAEALDRLGQMEREAFWLSFHEKAQEIAAQHGNGALILALIVAVFEDVEAADKGRRNDNITQKGA